MYLKILVGMKYILVGHILKCSESESEPTSS